LTGRAIKVTWGNLGRLKEKEMAFRKFIASDEPVMVLTKMKNDVIPFLNSNSGGFSIAPCFMLSVFGTKSDPSDAIH
jgi:hypothetical protein